MSSLARLEERLRLLEALVLLPATSAAQSGSLVTGPAQLGSVTLDSVAASIDGPTNLDGVPTSEVVTAQLPSLFERVGALRAGWLTSTSADFRKTVDDCTWGAPFLWVCLVSFRLWVWCAGTLSPVSRLDPVSPQTSACSGPSLRGALPPPNLRARWPGPRSRLSPRPRRPGSRWCPPRPRARALLQVLGGLQHCQCGTRRSACWRRRRPALSPARATAQLWRRPTRN